MKETPFGYLIAESKKEATEVLRKMSNDDEINTTILAESEYSNQNLNKYFDGVAAAEKKLFPDKEMHTCDNCGRTFDLDDRAEYRGHANNCSEKKVKAVKKARKLLSDFSIGDGHYVYVLNITCNDGRKFWYVGQSERVRERIIEHVEKRRVKIPDENGRLRKGENYSVASVEEMISADSQPRAEEIERRRAFELCLEHETLNILGGR